MGRKKGSVHPSSPRESSPDAILKLLPLTILALATSLPSQDREVLAYLIARSINVFPFDQPCKKAAKRGARASPFGCGCFECYTTFWCRWDASPNREVIHQAIEAFEEHLGDSEGAKGESEIEGKKEGGSAAEEEEAGFVGGGGSHKCLARKVLPDVVGLFNSRFWGLWTPSI